ncbi:hypothetical protein Ahy_B09g097824 [Arachis hypogaea]|uniref:SWIM-type domain-containing protein n=1 Tax=Arachis hypogaea TaxID=3818 RepID=A0A444XQ15_ARAHY|nr:hypothetical protein Ahy_B09g097824 [Arachis hypogaea]
MRIQNYYKELGYDNILQCWWLPTGRSLDGGLRAFTSDDELRDMCFAERKNDRVIDLYFEYGVSILELLAGKEVVIWLDDTHEYPELNPESVSFSNPNHSDTNANPSLINNPIPNPPETNPDPIPNPIDANTIPNPNPTKTHVKSILEPKSNLKPKPKSKPNPTFISKPKLTQKSIQKPNPNLNTKLRETTKACSTPKGKGKSKMKSKPQFLPRRITRSQAVGTYRRSTNKGKEVLHVDLTVVVDLKKRLCTCQFWMLTVNKRPEDFCRHLCTMESYNKTYAHHINPLPGQSLWEKSVYSQPQSLNIRRRPGVLTKKRRKDADEGNGGNKKAKPSESLKRHLKTFTCRYCGINPNSMPFLLLLGLALKPTTTVAPIDNPPTAAIVDNSPPVEIELSQPNYEGSQDIAVAAAPTPSRPEKLPTKRRSSPPPQSIGVDPMDGASVATSSRLAIAVIMSGSCSGDMPSQSIGSHSSNSSMQRRRKIKDQTCFCGLKTTIKKSGHILEIPQIELEDKTEIWLRNMVALEQCYYPDEFYITDYTAVLDYLINTEKDADFLVKRG